MAPQSSIELPIIDFSKIDLLIPGSPEWESTKRQVHEALAEYGFFEAVYDIIPLDLRLQLFASSKQLFDLPLSTKLQNSSNYGYVAPTPPSSLYESIGIGSAPILERAEAFTNSMWPQGNPTFCNTVHSYAQQVAVLDQVIKRMVFESLGVEKYLEEHMKSTDYTIRLNKYEPEALETDNAYVGAGSHTDKTFMSILSQNQVNGLQFRTKDGQWLDVKFSPNSFAVLTGDLIMAWTNGRLHSPHHRVMMTGTETRYSSGLFSTPKAGYIVKAPEELVDEQHPLLFKPFDYFELVASERYFSGTLKAYCGV